MAIGQDSDIQKLLQAGYLIDGPSIDDSEKLRKGKQVQWVIKKTVRAPRNDPEKMAACRIFIATMVEFYINGHEKRSPPISSTIYELLYGKGPRAIRRERSTESSAQTPSFTWYHLPANNVSVFRYESESERSMLIPSNTL